jgi:hypothetical protein
MDRCGASLRMTLFFRIRYDGTGPAVYALVTRNLALDPSRSASAWIASR